MATFSQFTPYVHPEVAGAPLPLLEDAILDGAREFASRTWVFRSQLAVSLLVGTRSYALAPSATTEVVSATALSVDGAAPAESVAPTQDMRLNPTSGTPNSYWVDGQSLMVYPTPDVAVAAIVEVATQPTQGATVIPDNYLPYRAAIAAWARYSLMKMVGQPWSNTEGAAIALTEFQRQVHLCAYEQNTGKSAAPLRVVTNFF